MSNQQDPTRHTIRVPGPSNGRREPVGDVDDPEGLVSPADLGSASRSCLAIIVILLLIALLLCVFVLAQPFLD